MEIRALIEGVHEFGEGRWAAILGNSQAILINRTPTDLRMKYRNLVLANMETRVVTEDGKGVKQRRKAVRWSEVETNRLKELVEQFGEGKWKQMLAKGKRVFNECRTPTDLKDKWRSLQGRKITEEQPKRLYRLLHSEGIIFKNRFPRDAAMKAASRGWPRIALLDLSSEPQMVHIYSGHRLERNVREIKDKKIRKQKFGNAKTFWEPKVSKIGVQALGIYLKQSKATKSPVPLEPNRSNAGGRPTAEESKQNTQKRGGKRGKGRGKAPPRRSTRGRKGVVPPAPPTEAELKEIES